MGGVMPKLRNFLLALLVASAVPCCGQVNSRPESPNVEAYFRRYVGFSTDEIAVIRSGTAVAKTVHSRTPAEIFVVGAVEEPVVEGDLEIAGQG